MLRQAQHDATIVVVAAAVEGVVTLSLSKSGARVLGRCSSASSRSMLRQAQHDATVVVIAAGEVPVTLSLSKSGGLGLIESPLYRSMLKFNMLPVY